MKMVEYRVFIIEFGQIAAGNINNKKEKKEKRERRSIFFENTKFIVCTRIYICHTHFYLYLVQFNRIENLINEILTF